MKGVLIEPTKTFNKLVYNRPNCMCYNVAVNYIKEPVKFIGESATAGLVDAMSHKFKKLLHPHSSEYYVNGEPISDILDKSNIKYIDLMTIDVEGGEEVVLKTMDFNIPVYLICIELDGFNPEKDERCRKILLNNEFTFKKRLCINEFWVNDNYYRKKMLYDTNIKKLEFTKNIYDIGNFPYLEKHVRNEVEIAIKENLQEKSESVNFSTGDTI